MFVYIIIYIYISGNLPYIAGVQPPHQLASPESKQRLGSFRLPTSTALPLCHLEVPSHFWWDATSKIAFLARKWWQGNFQAQSFESLESMFEGVILSHFEFLDFLLSGTHVAPKVFKFGSPNRPCPWFVWRTSVWIVFWYLSTVVWRWCFDYLHQQRDQHRWNHWRGARVKV